MMSKTLLPIPEVPGLFVDAMLTDAGSNLLFMSAWGRDTVCQEFMARLSMPVQEGGLDRFQVGDGADMPSRYIQSMNPERLKKKTCRTDQTIFGALAQLWLYDPLISKPDNANRRGYLLYQVNDDQQRVDQRLWQLIKETCHLPLLDHWRVIFVDLCQQEGWVTHLDGLGVNAWLVELDSRDLESEVTRLIQKGHFLLDPTPKTDLSLVANKLESESESTFGEVIYSYTRAQALSDGVLVDITAAAREVGFNCPVAMTQAAWQQCVFWSKDDSDAQSPQDERGRLHDVVWMALNGIRQHKEAGQMLLFTLLCVPRDGVATEAVEVTLKLMTGPGDQGEQVMTILLPGED